MDAYLAYDFPGKEEAIQQIKVSHITREYTKWYLSIKFYPDRSLNPIPTTKRVPVLMLAFIDNRAPLEFMLHIIDGYVDEFEIFFADSTEISDSIDLTNVRLEYMV